MCTLVLLRRPDHPWPLILAANRDEMTDRPARPPGRHWPELPGVVAGLDVLAGGSWLGLNDRGVVGAALNRIGSLGPSAGKRSRGELVLAALERADAAAAAAALSGRSAADYRSFNLVVADATAAFWLRNRVGEAEAGTSETGIEVFELPPGLSMITAHDRNDLGSARIRTYLPRLRSAQPPDPAKGDWRAWQEILASRQAGPDGDPYAAMTVATDRGFGTVSSSLVALPKAGGEESPVWLYAPGPPDRTPFAPVAI